MSKYKVVIKTKSKPDWGSTGYDVRIYQGDRYVGHQWTRTKWGARRWATKEIRKISKSDKEFQPKIVTQYYVESKK